MNIENNEPSDIIYCLIKIKRHYKERKIKFSYEGEELKNIISEEISIENYR